MVIKKNPKTGKYYIAPSKKSFYESNPSPSGGSSSVNPGQAVYVNIDDINKPSGEIYTRGSGGGFIPAGKLSSGGVSSSATSRKFQAEQQKQEEQRKLEEQLRKQREEKAFSGTIAGQLKTNKDKGQIQPLTVNVYDPEKRYTQTPYRQGFFTSLGMATTNFLKDISPFHRGGTRLQSPEKYTDIFEYSEGLKRDEVVYINPQFGTVQINPVTGQQITGEVTYGDIQRERESKREQTLFSGGSNFSSQANVLFSETQSKVNKGEIDVVTGQAIVDEGIKDINERYATFQEQTYKENQDIPGVFERTGKARRIANIAPDVIAIGGIATVSAVNPVLGASLGVGYFTGKGVLQANSKPTFKEIGQQGGLFANVGDDGFGSLKILEPTELDVRYKNIRKEAGVNLLFGVTSGVSLVGASSRGIIQQELFELGEQPVIVKSITAQSGNTGFDIIRGVQTKAKISREFTIIGKVETQGGQNFIMPSGTGYSSTAGTFDWQLYQGYGTSYYAGGDIFNVGVKGASIPVEGGVFTFGKGVIQPQLSFGGVFKEFTPKTLAGVGNNLKVGGYSQGGFFIGASKRIGVDSSGAEFYKSVSGSVNRDIVSGKGFSIFTGVSDFNPNTFGVQKIVRVSGSSIDDVYRVRGSGSTTKSIKGLSGSSAQESLLGDFSKTISSQQSKTVKNNILFGGSSGGGTRTSIITKEPEIIRNISSQVLSQPVKQEQGRAVAVSNIFPPSVGTKSFSAVIQKQNIMFGQSEVLKQDIIQRKNVSQRSIQKQILEQVPVQPSITASQFFGLPNIGGFDFGLPPLPKGDFRGGMTRRRHQRGKQRTAYQTSLTGSILGIRGTGVAPGALSVRGIINKKTNRKKVKIL